MPRFKDQAVCIRHIDWSETSQIVALLTEGHGIVRGLAKGAKRMSPGAVARFSGGIGLLTLGQVVATTKASAELATITEWDLQQPYPHLHEDLTAHRLALFAADLTGAMIADSDPHAAVFTALSRLLAALAEPAQRPAALLQYQWRLLAECGYRPELKCDVRTGEVLAKRTSYTFDPHAGGLTLAPAPAKGDSSPGPWRVRRQTVELLRSIDGDGEDGGSPPATDAAALERANRLLCVYARAILDRQLPTMGFVLGSAP